MNRTDIVSFDPTEEPLATFGDALLYELGQSIAKYGFAALPNAIAPNVFKAIQMEAEEKFDTAVLAEQSGPLSYRANITGLGAAARNFLHHRRVIALLTTLFGGDYVLSEHISCLTFYDDGGYLGAHLDEPASECSVTIIIYLIARSPNPDSPDTGLVLCVYGESHDTIGNARLCIPTKAGTIVFGRGSRVWHERPKLQSGEYVVAITGCYRQAG